MPEKKYSSARARGFSSAQRRTDSFWAKDMIKRVKIINGKGATWKTWDGIAGSHS